MQSFSIILILISFMISLVFMTVSYPGGSDSWITESAFAQLTNNNNIIQIVSTSTYVDDFGNFHVVGEVNNTSTDPQTNILVTTFLSDTNNNILVGNHSAFSSIGTLRQGELSPFDIVIQDPQILGKFNFMEFSTTSKPAIEKPSTLILNGSSSFLDNVGNPHITGNIINQGPSPEQFLNLVTTFYDNSSLGVIGTQSFGLNVGSLANNQMAPFDITITDNKTKSQAKFYSLNVDSVQSSMNFPLNPKFPLEPIGGFVDSGLFLDSPLNVNPLSTTGNNFNSDSDQSSSSGSDNDNSDGSDASNNDLEIAIAVEKDPIVRGNVQTIDVTVSDANTREKIARADVAFRIFYAGEHDESGNGQTNQGGVATFKDEIGPNSKPGTFDVTINVDADGYDTETDKTTFEVIEKSEETNDTSSQNNSTDSENNNSTLTNGSQNESNDDINCGDVGETNTSVVSDAPNNLDTDGDGIGCESDDASIDEITDSQDNQNEQENGGSLDNDNTDSTNNDNNANNGGSKENNNANEDNNEEQNADSKDNKNN